MKVTLHDPSDRDRLRQLVRDELHAKQRDRYRVVLLAAEGIDGRELKREEIATFVLRSRQFVDEWVKRYRRNGIDDLRAKKQPGKPPRLSKQEKEELKATLDAGPQPQVDDRCVFFGEDIRKLIERKFNKTYSLSGVYNLLHKLGYSWLCPRPHHPKGDATEQEAFKKVVQTLEQIRSEHPKQRVLTFFQDEARFGQKGTLTRLWAKRNSRPTMPKQSQFDYLYVFGAVCPRSGTSVALVAPRVDTAIMNHFLEQFSRSLASDVHAVMILDRAGWHISHELVTPSNVTLIYLPLRSPELNPMENLWHWITSHHWSNRLHASYNTMVDAATNALQTTFTDNERIKSICNAPYLDGARIK